MLVFVLLQLQIIFSENLSVHTTFHICRLYLVMNFSIVDSRLKRISLLEDYFPTVRLAGHFIYYSVRITDIACNFMVVSFISRKSHW